MLYYVLANYTNDEIHQKCGIALVTAEVGLALKGERNFGVSNSLNEST